MPSLRSLSVVAVALFATVAASGGSPAVKIRRVSVTPDVPLDLGIVKSTLATELSRVDGAHTSGRRRADLAVSVTRKNRDEHEVEYVVSAVVTDARKGNVLGMLEGHAHSPRSPQLERTTLEYAAHGALSNLPVFLR